MYYLIGFLFLVIVKCERFPELTTLEKDRYLTCLELVMMQMTHDKKTIRETLTQQSFLYTGINTKIRLDMILNCITHISDELVGKIYKDGVRVVTMESIDEDEITYIRVNYTDYKDMQQFEVEGKIKEVLYYASHVMKKPGEIDPYSDEEYEKRMQAKVEQFKKSYEKQLNNPFSEESEETKKASEDDNSLFGDSETFSVEYDIYEELNKVFGDSITKKDESNITKSDLPLESPLSSSEESQDPSTNETKKTIETKPDL